MKKTKIKRKTEAGKEKKEAEKKKEVPAVEKQAIILIAIMVFILVTSFVFIYFYKQNKFRYEGFVFERRNFGQIIVYNTTIPIRRDGQSVIYSLFLRNDPRKLDFPVNASIRFMHNIIISFDPNISGCYASNLAAYELDSFLNALGLERKGATTSVEEAIKMNRTKANCSDAIGSTVIVLEPGEKTEILQDKEYKDCYKIKIANCEILKATEKFIIETAKQLRK